MHILKKKEFWIVGGILLLTLILMILSIRRNQLDEASVEVSSEQEEIVSETESRFITLTIVGEIVLDELVLTVPKGTTYGNLVEILRRYTNDYSVLKIDFKTKYTQDQVIEIPSTDEGVYEEDILDIKLNLNTATKEELISLYGIGDKRADRIIEYRKTKKITTFQELKSLIGVSDEVISRIQEKAVL